MIKRLLTVIICFCITLFVYIYQDVIIDNIYNIYNSFREPEYELTTTEYTKGSTYEFIQKKEDLVPYNFQDLLNIFYTALDNRYSSVTFYCPREYKECLDDIETFRSEDYEETLTIIGNLVSPYNNYTNVSVYYDTSGKIMFNITYLYDDEMIEYVNNKIDEVLNSITNDSMTDQEKITAIHDYLAIYADYDTKYEEEIKLYGKSTYPSNTAYGLFKNKLAICSGYTDTLALFLDKLNISNMKVASETHIWNVIKTDQGYRHIDITWDDPPDNIFGIVLREYLIIDTNTLMEKNDQKHIFNKSIYTELT